MKNSKPSIIVPTEPLWYGCSCGNREWAIQGFPQGNALKLIRAICTRCKRVYPIDQKGSVGGFINAPGGKVSHIIHKGEVKENV